MKSLIDLLYYLDDTPLKTHEKSFKVLSKEMNSLLFYEIRQYLPQEQKKLALRVEEIYGAMLSVESEAAFCRGFSTAVKLLLEAVAKDTD